MNDCQTIRSKYCGFVPAIILPDKEIEMCKRRFLLPENENFGYCVASIRKYIQVKPNEAVFFSIDNKIMDMQQNIGAFYSQYKRNKNLDEAFLYISIMKESTFGRKQKLYRNVPWIQALAPTWLD